MTDREQNRIYRIHPHREGIFAAAVVSIVVLAIWWVNNIDPTLLALPLVAYLAGYRATKKWDA